MTYSVTAKPKTLLIACGALGREIINLIDILNLKNITVQCLPAHFHNTPDKIPGGVEKKIEEAGDRFDRILVLYGECGTGGKLDAILQREGIERIPGAHCYEFFMGQADFKDLFDAEPGSFFLTDYLVKHFDQLIIQGLGLDRFPQLLGDYFGNYSQLVYMAQTSDPDLDAAAMAAAEKLKLNFERRFTGYGDLKNILKEGNNGSADHSLLA
jgi:hypothetical protein